MRRGGIVVEYFGRGAFAGGIEKGASVRKSLFR